MTCLPDDEFGGLAVDDESDIEAKALITNPPLVVGLKKPKKLYANVKIEPNTTVEPGKSTLKSFRNGAENWLLEHLPAGTSGRYTNDLVPRTRKAIGSTMEDPWDPLPASELQVIVNEVFGKGKYDVETDPSFWFDEIPSSRLAKRPEEHGATTEEEPELTTQEEIAAMINAYLNYQEVQPGKSEYQMHTYFMPGGRKVQRALECFKVGDKPDKKAKLPAFSSAVYGDKRVRDIKTHKSIKIRTATWLVGTLKDFKDDEWNRILSSARTYLPNEKRKSSSSSTSSSVPTLAESEEEDDSIAKFVIP
ncbi:hypothetical protein F5887DRAFT_1076968 [Amanita rubescens]|nr:hypothetical protein F5887DRAFT_1076968 [Amanita rubescens]